jgi:hypothetical protein
MVRALRDVAIFAQGRALHAQIPAAQNGDFFEKI